MSLPNSPANASVLRWQQQANNSTRSSTPGGKLTKQTRRLAPSRRAGSLRAVSEHVWFVSSEAESRFRRFAVSKGKVSYCLTYQQLPFLQHLPRNPTQSVFSCQSPVHRVRATDGSPRGASGHPFKIYGACWRLGRKSPGIIISSGGWKL